MRRSGVWCGGRVGWRGVAALLWVAPVAATTVQEPLPRYSAAILDGASFDQRVRATIRTQTGGAARTEQIGREARIEVRAAPAGNGVEIEAWFDSLHIWRDGPEGRIAPDTDGLIGGRYRGTLAGDGRYRVALRPFVPDEVSEVGDFATALDDLFPPLPGAALAVGGRWDEEVLRIVRRPDSVVSGVALLRFRWARARADTVTRLTEDSLPFVTRTTLREEGDLVWHRSLGPLAWHRRAATDLEIPVEGAVRRAVRTRIDEELWIWRRRGT